MTRSWTDPRTGKRWHIDVVLGPGRGSAPGRGNSAEAGSALVFDSGDGSFSLPTEDASRLEALEDEKLAELLDAAKSGSAPQGGGRKSQPHQDPAKRGESGKK